MKVQLSNSGNKRLQLSTEPEEKNIILPQKQFNPFLLCCHFLLKILEKLSSWTVFDQTNFCGFHCFDLFLCVLEE